MFQEQTVTIEVPETGAGIVKNFTLVPYAVSALRSHRLLSSASNRAVVACTESGGHKSILEGQSQHSQCFWYCP